MDNSVQEVDKKLYTAPQLIIYGNIEEITQASEGNSHDDGIFLNNNQIGAHHGSQDARFGG